MPPPHFANQTPPSASQLTQFRFPGTRLANFMTSSVSYYLWCPRLDVQNDRAQSVETLLSPLPHPPLSAKSSNSGVNSVIPTSSGTLMLFGLYFFVYFNVWRWLRFFPQRVRLWAPSHRKRPRLFQCLRCPDCPALLDPIRRAQIPNALSESIRKIVKYPTRKLRVIDIGHGRTAYLNTFTHKFSDFLNLNFFVSFYSYHYGSGISLSMS